MAGSHLPPMFTRRSDGLGSLFREIERTFDDFSRRGPFAGFAGLGEAPSLPKVDVLEGRDAVDITAELPGCHEGDIDVTLSEGVLTIRGEKKSEREEADKDKHWHVVERSYGAFSRSIPLPFTPDASKVEAKFDKGVLRVKLPKPAEAATKENKIEVRSVDRSPSHPAAGKAEAASPATARPDQGVHSTGKGSDKAAGAAAEKTPDEHTAMSTRPMSHGREPNQGKTQGYEPNQGKTQGYEPNQGKTRR